VECFNCVFGHAYIWWCVCVRVGQAILAEVPRLQHIIVVDNTATTWSGYPRGISIHSMAAVQNLGTRTGNGKLSDCAFTFSHCFSSIEFAQPLVQIVGFKTEKDN